jgi:hypothetical protein
MKTQIFIHITHNQITNKKVIRKAFEQLKDGRYLVSIESGNNRSNPQNAYYWGCCLPLIKDGLIEVGYREITSNEQVHDLMKYMFLKKRIVNEETGEVIETIGSTAKLTTIEFMEYIDRIAQFSAEMLGVVIPAPNTQMDIFYKQDLKPSIID